jgi:hypothetical protein
VECMLSAFSAVDLVKCRSRDGGATLGARLYLLLKLGLRFGQALGVGCYADIKI